MKSAHRHQLETNELAHRLELYIARYRPYGSMIVGGLIALVALVFVWSYISGTSAARRSEAWNSYNLAIASRPPNLDEIHRTAEEYPGTKMQQMADVTWADGQVLIASRNYLGNRPAAMENLNRAMSAYQGVIQSSQDERLTGRARLGVARIYEMQNHLDKARDEYRQVTGTYSDYAKQQAERLAKPDAAETCAWLATAQPPRPKAPVGPGTPGQQPEFSPGEISLPSAGGPQSGKTEDTKSAADSFENLLKSMQQESKNGDAAERYKTEQATGKDSKTTPPAKDSSPAEPKNEPKDSPAPTNSGESGGSKPAETPPATDKPAK